MDYDPIKAYARKARAQRRVGMHAVCACGEIRPQALIAGQTPALCFACDRAARGRQPFDYHHVFGKRNGALTLRVPVNEHRAVYSVAQYEWPPDTLENPDGSPLLRATAYVRGARLTIIQIIEDMFWIEPFLERLDAWLTETIGRFWWRKSPIASFAVSDRKVRKDDN